MDAERFIQRWEEIISGTLAWLIFLLVGIAVYMHGWLVGIAALLLAFSLSNIFRPAARKLARWLFEQV